MARILIVGCGYVGSALAKAYLASGANEVYALQRHPVDIPGIHNSQGDICDITLQIQAPFDCVFYLVSADEHTESAYQRAYINGVRRLLEQLPKHASTRLIFISSTAVYGQQQGEWVDESSPTSPNDFAGRCLLEGEQLILQSGLDHVIVRFGGIYGPSRTRTIEQLKNGHAYLTAKPCYTNRIHLDDCVGSLQYLAEKSDCPAIVLGVDCEPVLYNDLQLWLAQQLNVPIPTIGETPARLQKSNKRCSNQLLLSLGYHFRFPNYQLGYRMYLD